MKKRFKLPTSVQSVMFDKSIWTPTAARAWLKQYGFDTKTQREEKNYIRFRQAVPAAFQRHTFRTQTFGGDDQGIKAIIAVPKREARKNPTDRYTRKLKLVRHNVPDVLADLGRPLAIELTDGSQLDFNQSWIFAATETGQTIWLIKRTRGRTVRNPNNTKIVQKTKNLFERFTDFEPRHARKMAVDDRQNEFRNIGRVRSFAYESDKWTGRPTGYIHEYKNAPSIWANGDGKVTLFRIRGPRTRITVRGVEG